MQFFKLTVYIILCVYSLLRAAELMHIQEYMELEESWSTLLGIEFILLSIAHTSAMEKGYAAACCGRYFEEGPGYHGRHTQPLQELGAS